MFLDTGKGDAPNVSWVSLAYLPKNVAPVIDDIVVQDPGVRVAGSPIQSTGPGAATSVQLRAPRPAGGNAFPSFVSEDANKGGRVDITPQGVEEKGYQTVLWSAHDDNDDDLLFTIYFRGENEQNWRLLKDKLTQHYYSWDTESMPDGAYYLNIVATDSGFESGRSSADGRARKRQAGDREHSAAD